MWRWWCWRLCDIIDSCWLPVVAGLVVLVVMVRLMMVMVMAVVVLAIMVGDSGLVCPCWCLWWWCCWWWWCWWWWCLWWWCLWWWCCWWWWCWCVFDGNLSSTSRHVSQILFVIVVLVHFCRHNLNLLSFCTITTASQLLGRVWACLII